MNIILPYVSSNNDNTDRIYYYSPFTVYSMVIRAYFIKCYFVDLCGYHKFHKILPNDLKRMLISINS